MRVIFTPLAINNPYQYFLADMLSQFGLQIEFLSKLPREDWFLQNAKGTTILHIHWVSPLYIRHWKTPLWFARFIIKLILARLLGYKIVWTVHNILPHKDKNPVFNVLGRLSMAILANDIIFHCRYAREEFTSRFLRKKNLHIIPHGNYLNWYKPLIKKTKAREKLRIHRDAFVYLFFGKICVYKGIQDLLSSFKQSKDPKVVLLIAGHCDPEEESALYKMSGDDSRIHLLPGFVDPNDVHYYLSAADVFVVPFRNVLTSGSAILAMSYGLPVIAPAIGCLPETIKPNAGILYDSAGGNELYKALESIKELDVKSMGADAYRLAKCLDWQGIAEKTYKIYGSYV